MSTESLANHVKARIVEVDEYSGPKYSEKKGGLSLSCMFNPYEYATSQTNSYTEYASKDRKHANSEYKKTGSQTLTLSLFFDTYEEGTDVTKYTNKLWAFMAPKEVERAGKKEKTVPPLVAFIWGSFFFVAKITNMTQRFILFKHDGTPVRARADVTFTQNEDIEEYAEQNPSSGGGPINRLWAVRAGDRLDLIAAEVYLDANRWRTIAEFNRIKDPLTLRPGQLLQIPLG
jgi:hypothetical protein